jgi:DNA-binding NarL/FixJ family response regulator
MKTAPASRRNGKGSKIKLLLVDDHELALEALKLYFSIRSNFDVAALAVDRLDALQNAKKKAPDVVMLNMRMPQVDAAAATKRLLDRLPKTKVIGFSGLEDRTVVLSMIRAGARGYLLKECTSRELFRAVEAVNGGAAFFSASVSKMIEEDYLQSVS